MKIVKAILKDKYYLVKANNEVNRLSGLITSGLFEANFEKDFLCDNPKCFAIIAVENGTPIGMCLYSYVYWANKGRGIYLSNAYVEPSHRNKGIFKSFINYIKNNHDFNFFTGIVGDENELMHKVFQKLGAEDIKMSTYSLKNIQ